MKRILALMLALPFAAQAYDLNAIQQQLMNNPEVQQAVGAQVMKQATKPTAAAAATGQNALLMQAFNAAASKYLTPAETKSLNAYKASPTGASVMAKLPQIAQELMPVLLQMYGKK
jgi:hypothetical protein